MFGFSSFFAFEIKIGLKGERAIQITTFVTFLLDGGRIYLVLTNVTEYDITYPETD
jgi:hypothetical protein